MSATSIQTQANQEEAINIANELIYGLDNLPAEVRFLLDEIQAKDARVEEINKEIQSLSSKYVRQGLRASATEEGEQSSKVAATPAKIRTLYSEIDGLSDEKISIAEKLFKVMQSNVARLEVDLKKVRVLEGVPEPPPAAPELDVAFTADSAATQLTQSLQNHLLSAPSPAPAPPVAQTPDPAPSRKRKQPPTASIGTTATAVSHVASPRPSPAPASSVNKRGHSSRAAAINRPSTLDLMDVVDTEDDPEDELLTAAGDEGDDDGVYCYCQSKSYGDMIACDNEESCKYEWFHLSCVNLRPPLPKTWFCKECAEARQAAASAPSAPGRPGRKRK